jgi:hypothetical protein
VWGRTKGGMAHGGLSISRRYRDGLADKRGMGRNQPIDSSVALVRLAGNHYAGLPVVPSGIGGGWPGPTPPCFLSLKAPHTAVSALISERVAKRTIMRTRPHPVPDDPDSK